MPNTHIVQENESLSRIAADNRTTPAALRKINPELDRIIGANDEIALPPGLKLTIPDPETKSERVAANQPAPFRADIGRKYLRLTLQDEFGNPLTGWTYELKVHGEGVESGGVPANGVITTKKPIPRGCKRADLGLWQHLPGAPRPSHLRSRLHSPPIKMHEEWIELHVGGMESLVTADGGKTAHEPGGPSAVAIQKILRNLGHYHGPIDGNLENEDSKHDKLTRRALRTFQQLRGLPITGLADQETCDRLIQAQGNLLLPPPRPEQSSALQASRDDPLDAALGPNPGDPRSAHVHRGHEPITDHVVLGAEYLAPPAEDSVPSGMKPHLTEAYDSFPNEAFVAPCSADEEEKKKNPNVIRKSSGRFIFLDTGAWSHQDGHKRFFGLIWGRHVYLCEYNAGQGRFIEGAVADRLDAKFLNAMRDRVRVVSQASATWAPAADFKWDKLYLIVPDLHLMTGRNSAIWKPNTKRRAPTSTGYAPYYNLQPEIDLLEFTERVVAIDELRGTIKAVQIGDAYDLWLGYSLEPHEAMEERERLGLGAENYLPLFRANDENEKYEVELLYAGAEERIAQWVHEIQGRDPALNTQFWNLREDKFEFGNWVKESLLESGLSDEQIKHFAAELRQWTEGGQETWLNPAERALELLEERCELTYVYGNHDNYLILPSVQKAAFGLFGQNDKRRVRKSCFKPDGVFMEHGHRIEWIMDKRERKQQTIGLHDFIPVAGPFIHIPRNYDGAVSGYEACTKIFRSFERTRDEDPSREGGGLVDTVKMSLGADYGLTWQKETYREFARLWSGLRASKNNALKPPHIFVVGHTHYPNLFCVNF